MKFKGPKFASETVEPQHDKTNRMTCAPKEDTSAWASVQSDRSPHCQHEESFPLSAQRRLISVGGFQG